jgi:hypothetical protein
MQIGRAPSVFVFKLDNVGQDGILQRIGNPLGLPSVIDQANCQSAAD